LKKKRDQFAAQMAALRLFSGKSTENEGKIVSILAKAEKIAGLVKESAGDQLIKVAF